jgi:spore coat protein U-like protein
MKLSTASTKRKCLVVLLTTLLCFEANAVCRVRSIVPVAFGNYNVFSATPTTGVGSFTVGRCTVAVPYVATFSAGSSGNINARTMTSGTNVLSYNLYDSIAYTTVLGGVGGIGAAVTGAGVTARSGAIVSIYGRIPAGQDAMTSVTPYSDTVTITITF